MPHQCTNCGKTFDDGSKEMLSGCPDCGGNKFQFRPKRATQTESDSTESASTPRAVSPSQPSDDDQSTTERTEGTEQSDRSGVTGTAAKAGASVREWVGNRTSNPDETDEATDTPASDDVTIEPTDDPSDEPQSVSAADEAPERPAEGESADLDSPDTPDSIDSVDSIENTEDRAQASARSDVVTPEELSAAEQRPTPEQPSDADGTVVEPKSDDRPDLSDLREELNDQFESIKILNPGQYELNLMELYDRDEYIISLREDGRYVIEVPDRWQNTGRDE